jgi:hypothetical protein
MKNPLVIALIVVVGYLLWTRSKTTTTSNPSGSSGTAQGVGTSLDSLIKDFTALFSGIGKAVAGSGSSDSANAGSTI